MIKKNKMKNKEKFKGIEQLLGEALILKVLHLRPQHSV